MNILKDVGISLRKLRVGVGTNPPHTTQIILVYWRTGQSIILFDRSDFVGIEIESNQTLWANGSI